jgi:hypothetical protein
MKKAFLFFLSITFVLADEMMAQTAIHDATIIPANQDPHSSAVLDVKSTNKGVLVPNVSLTDLGSNTTPVSGPATGLLVYNTNVGTGVGYYYWDGGAWRRLMTSANTPTGSGTLNYVPKWTPSGIVLGNSQIFDNGTNVGIGTTTNSEKLHVNGNLRLAANGSITTDGESLQIMRGVRADDNSYEWTGFYSGNTRQGIILYDGAWAGANNITDEFSITAENGNRLTLNTQADRHIALMPKGTGNVGINTLTPVARLEIEGPAANWNETTPGLTTGSLHLDPGSSSPHIGSAITWGAHDAGAGDNAQAGIYVRSDGSYGTKMYFGTTDAYVSGSKTRMYIGADGNVGIGTTAPVQKLHVVGQIAINDNDTRMFEGNGNAVRIQTNSGFIDIGAQNTSHAHIYTDRATFYMDKGLYAGNGNTLLNVSTGNSFVNGGNFGVGNTGPNHKLHVTGDIWAEGRYVVQNATDGGTTRGIRLWTAADSNWGIYMGTPGAGKSLSGGTAVAGEGFASHAVRLRVHNAATNGFIIENSSEQNLFSIRGNNGRAYFRGGVQFGCPGCGSTTTIDGTDNWGNMTIQGRVISANANIHLSPPGGSNVIINTAYRAAGGAGGTAGLQVQSLEGTGSRPVYADANGTLRTTGNSGWTLSSHLAFSPDDISGHSNLSGDDVYVNVNMPFSVQIDGVNHSAITISTNGWVAFGTISSSIISTGCLPNGSFSVPVVAWYMRDLVTVGTNIRYLTVGSSPNRTFIVDFEAYAYGAGSGDRVRGQVQIHETSSMISVKYRDTHNTMNGQNAVIGFQMAGGSSAKAFPITCLGKVMDDNRPSEGWSVSPVR